MKKRRIYLNHNGGVDDLISLYLLLKMEDAELVGVSVMDADCYIQPAASATRKIIEKFGSEKDKKIKIALSDSRAVNPFPKDWRMHAFVVDALPILNEKKPLTVEESNIKAHEDIIRVLKESDEKTDLVFIEPLTDLARALDKDSSIEEKIGKLYWMGGTFLEHGNVEEPEHDGTAEWNVYWDPFAAKRVWESNIKIELVALESTRMVPLTAEVRDMWASQRKYEGVDFLGQCYATVSPLTHFVTNSTYFLWDVLTTASFGKENLVKREVVNSDVITEGPNRGRTVRKENGRPVDLVYHVDRDSFFEYITDLAKQ
ncbi:inosine-uridine preferring nucleoside hydrolase [Pseudoleptotrichia goodfellowii]|uniref:Inosine-uridine preferring nucleoside hydrolase n=3 Tax=Pseudoleptotrichia goodfellowii TaxID=157692 RepID=A0A510JAT0_9FUSO|nr:nucleoside hydrolase [Pseudoleptotrichia goodfellowii]BBM36294.1 inosine-uridine preferring nucleoside hydrolase [Pseudoleptotrichia goodfellowii]